MRCGTATVSTPRSACSYCFCMHCHIMCPSWHASVSNAAQTPMGMCSTRVPVATILQIWHDQRLLRVLEPFLGLHEEADSLCASGRACMHCMFLALTRAYGCFGPLPYITSSDRAHGVAVEIEQSRDCTLPSPFPGEEERYARAPAVAASIKGGGTAVLGGGVWAPQRPGQRTSCEPAQAG